MKIVKGHVRLVLVHDSGGQLMTRDAAKDTLWHQLSPIHPEHSIISAPPLDGLDQGMTVQIFEFAAHRYPVCDPCGWDLGFLAHVRDEMSSGLSFHGRIGCENHFTDPSFLKPVGKKIQADFRGPNPVEW